jgi:hypothetical protein
MPALPGPPRIALRSPCSAQALGDHCATHPCYAQALGDHPWSPARRMRLAHGHPCDACVAPPHRHISAIVSLT